MDKLKMHSPDGVAANIARLAELFPGCVTETRDEQGQLKRGIDFDLLRQELSDHLVEGPQERYRLDWPGKREALLAANAPIAKTLRPCRAESVDFDTTQNLFIEGDNLEALKLLQETYLGKVKMIYIDPPYNTGTDFVYRDDFVEEVSAYMARSNQNGELGRLVSSKESEGRFHSAWLGMMYSRLRLARNLLAADGVFMASIDDCEAHNLRKILDEVFGEANFVAQLVWEKKKKGAFLSGSVTNIKEYVLVYARDISKFGGLIGEIARQEETYPIIKTTNSRGVRTIPAGIPSKFREQNWQVTAGSKISAGNMEMILHSDMVIRGSILINEVKVEANWIYSQQLIEEFARNGDLYVTQDLYFRRIVREPREKKLKDLLPMRGDDSTGSAFRYSDDLFSDGWGTNEDAFDELHRVLGHQNVMSFPKPSKLIAKLLLAVTRFDKSALVLDFFAGSCTVADAVFQLNLADKGNRRFVAVQIGEECAEDSEAFRAGYKTISQIGLERLRRVSAVLKQGAVNHDTSVDLGFRVMKIDTSNMADVHYRPDQLQQADLLGMVENIRPDRSAEDLLFQVLLDWGVDLGLPIRREDIAGREVFFVDGNALAACFVADGSVDEAFVRELAQRQPLRAVFRDRGFAGDNARINAEQIFKALSPSTDVRTL